MLRALEQVRGLDAGRHVATMQRLPRQVIDVQPQHLCQDEASDHALLTPMPDDTTTFTVPSRRARP
jgi:hypothetical protein